MSDLTGGGRFASAGNGRVGNNGASRSQQSAPAPTDSPGRIRGPTDIMRDRAERERKKAEKEIERARAEEEARMLEQDRRLAEKRDAAAGVAGERQSGGGGYDSSGSAQAPGQRRSDNSQNSERQSGGNAGNPRPQDPPIQGRGSGTALGGGQVAPTAAGRVRVPAATPGQPRPVRNTQTAKTSGLSQTPPGQTAAPAASQPAPESGGESSNANITRRLTQSTFPHAFERWETLSSHWEGLTSYWIRRIEENANEIQRDPVSSQLARQVTDLSAAGANLFHAVVELQKLRASSERKFQRWFFETRSDQERGQEIHAMLESALHEERRGRSEAIADAVAKEKDRSNSDKLLAEMKRELQISKEEARRAWEELGRREQEERERTMSLREGHPTLVGGVHVVPMMQGVPSRNASTTQRPQTRDGAYSAGPEAGAIGNLSLDGGENSVYHQAGRAPHDADPFVENSRPSAPASNTRRTEATQRSSTATSKPSVPQYSQAPAVQAPSASSTFYQQHQGTNLHPTEPVGSEGTYSDTEYDIDPTGQFRRDSRGNRIPYADPQSDEGSDEMDVAEERQRELAHLQQYGHAPVSTVGYVSGTSSAAVSSAMLHPDVTYGGSSGPVDYSGQAYGGDPWVSFPRHHHPSRLSDVLEEDERSRTSTNRRE